MKTGRFLPGTLGAAVLAMSLSTHAADNNIDNMADALVKLRGEVEELQNSLDNKKEQHRNRMASLAVQRTELEANMQRNQLELKQLKISLDDARKRAADSTIQGKDLKPLVIAAAQQLKSVISTGLPFKVQERMSALNEIVDQIELDILPPHKAVNRLWAFYDDEVRLTKESGIYRQPIKLGADDVLADVARVGMLFMYFQTSQGEFGKATHQSGEWSYVVTHDETEKKQISGLFDSLKKQIRTGYFELPNTLAAAE